MKKEVKVEESASPSNATAHAKHGFRGGLSPPLRHIQSLKESVMVSMASFTTVLMDVNLTENVSVPARSFQSSRIPSNPYEKT
jgi:hypothetical protein